MNTVTYLNINDFYFVLIWLGTDCIYRILSTVLYDVRARHDCGGLAESVRIL